MISCANFGHVGDVSEPSGRFAVHVCDYDEIIDHRLTVAQAYPIPIAPFAHRARGRGS